MTPQQFVSFGQSLEKEYLRLEASFHHKDSQRDTMGMAVDAIRARTNEVASALKIPGIEEKLAACTLLRHAVLPPDTMDAEAQWWLFRGIHEALTHTLKQALLDVAARAEDE